MNYKAYIYVLMVLLSAYTLSGVNFDGFIKKNKAWEARLLVLILSISLGYLLTNFITDFLSVSSILK